MDRRFFRLASPWIPPAGLALFALTIGLIASLDRPVQSVRAQELPATRPSVAATSQTPVPQPENEAALTADHTLPSETATQPAELSHSQVLKFRATAYCLKGITSSGVQVRSGIIAADPAVLPIGSVVRLKAGVFSGIYTVLDTGAKVKGNRIDIYLPKLKQCREFGYRKVGLEVLRKGWEPDSLGENMKP